MADLKISEMPDGGIAQVSDEIPVNRSNANFKVKVGSGATANIGNDVGDVIVWDDDGDGNPVYPYGDGQNIDNILANNVTYNNSINNLPSNNVQGAIDFLYDKTDPLSRIDVPPTYRFQSKPEQDDPLLDFERSTVANRINARGLIQEIDIDEIRHQYNPSLGSYLGWLVERSSTNLIPNSNDASLWSLNELTTSGGAITGPDGQVSGNKLIPSAVNTNHYIQMQSADAISVSEGEIVTGSCFAKAGEYGYLNITFGPTGLWGVQPRVRVNLNTGEIVQVSTGHSARVIPYPDGWYRVTLTATCTVAGSNARAAVWVGNPDGSVNSWAGDGVSGLYFFGGQWERRHFATSYIDTGATPVTRANDQASYTLPEAVTEGTIYFEGRSLDPAPSSVTFGRFLSISDGTANNAVYIEKTTDGLTRLQVVVGGVSYDSSTVNIPINTLFRAALSFKGGELYGAINGEPLTFSLMPTSINSMDTFRIGSYANGTNVNNGMISKDNAYYYRALDQDQINRITAI